jgi:hypothetical protein
VNTLLFVHFVFYLNPAVEGDPKGTTSAL